MDQKGFINILLIIIVVALVGVSVYFVAITQPTFTPIPTPSSTPYLHPSPRQRQTSSPTPSPSSTSTQSVSEYPFVIEALMESKLQSLDAEFKGLNRLRSCNREVGGIRSPDSLVLNNIGLLSEACRKTDSEQGRISEKDKLVERAKDWVIENSRFTGISDKLVLRIEKIIEIPQGIRIFFEGQKYIGLPVVNIVFRTMEIIIDEDGVRRAVGHWYPVIQAPLEPVISEDSAKNKLIGKIIMVGDVIVVPRITKGHLDEPAIKVIFVKHSTQGVEFRLAWKIPVLSNFYYIDAITGEILTSFYPL